MNVNVLSSFGEPMNAKDSNASNAFQSPFVNPAPHPLVALCGKRGGYLQVATSTFIDRYQELPTSLNLAALEWAKTLEMMGAKRVYWFILSEQVRHLHIHLYPRWSDDEALRGIQLFENRESLPQPDWSPSLHDALTDWANRHDVYLMPSN
jgi:hypothetical protein